MCGWVWVWVWVCVTAKGLSGVRVEGACVSSGVEPGCVCIYVVYRCLLECPCMLCRAWQGLPCFPDSCMMLRLCGCVLLVQHIKLQLVP